MHGCSSLSVLLVNAELDSMGGVVEGGVGIANKTSPRRAAIEKVQAELRQEYDVREKRKKELEFLEKGGDPLDFKHGNAASVSVQSTSFTDQHPEQLLTSEARGSFAFTTSPHGDSVESSGRLGANLSEPNSADNLMLFDAEHECSEGDRNSLHPGRSTIVPTEKLSQMDGSQRTRQHGDSPAFGLPRKAYKRRNRSRPNRDGTRSSSTDVNSTRASHGSSIPTRQGSREVKGFISDAENQNISSNCKTKPTSPVDGGVHKTGFPDSQQDMELDGGKAVESSKNMVEGVPTVAVSDAIASETPLDDQHNQYSNSGAVKASVQMDSNRSESIQAMEEMNSAVIECQPSTTAIKIENQSSSCHMNGFSSKREDGMKSDAHINSVSHGIKGLDSESSCTQTSLRIGGNNETDIFNKMGDANSNGKIKDQTLIPDGTLVVQGAEFVKEKKETEAVGSSTHVNVESTCQSQQENGCKLQPEEALTQSASALINEAKDHVVTEEKEAYGHTGSESGIKPSDTLGDNAGRYNENSCTVRLQDSTNISISDLPKDGMLTRLPSVSLEAQTSCGSDSKLARKIDEDSILKEAQIIEAKHKRISELSVATSPKQIRLKSHWDYVLEEMAWLANDFAQERVWKIAAAAQISSRAAFTCRLRKQEKSSGMEAKKVAHILAKSVMEFWRSVEETSKVLEQQSQSDEAVAVKAYAVRFLKHNNSNNVHNQAEVPLTPDRVSDMGIIDLSWEDNLTEENLFYTVPPGAMEMYKSSIEFSASQCERIGSSMQEEVETSACDATADFGSQDNAYDEDEETNTYDMPMAFEANKSSRLGQKKRKHLTHAYGVRSYEASSGILPMQCAENKAMAEQSALLAKRPGSSLNVSIPTKRVRTASRRVISPFSAGASGYIQVPNKTDASSGDTNSFQDDQSTLHGGSHVPNSLEVESVGDFEKQLPFESGEVSVKHKKKKKAKHLNVAYEPRWQVDSTFQNEQFQRDHLKKSHQLESNGSSGLLGQPMIKKPKTMRQSQDNSFENVAPIGGSVPSPVASQMSNMSNPNKFIKILAGRDRGRKPKVLKMPAGQPSSGSPWTLFEDQALVVLVHDMGPNWELISDAINSTLQFKCIFRKAKECKERHNFLMDRTSGDGADSAEDSGSSQPYPSTLPGIPKGSARQLFQRLQGPMEEDTLKSHFEKIIIIGQKQHYRKTQNDNQDPKPLQQPHSSHTTAFSQICPNNLNGGPILTPLDLCDASIPGPDLLSLGYQGTHSGGLAIPNQSTMTPMYPASGACSALQGSPNMMLGNSFSSSPGSLSSSVRDGRYGVPRSSSLSADEHQRMQQYNQMISSRSMTQPNISNGALPGAERGVRVLTGASGMGLASAVNRSMPMARPGYQGIAPSSSVVSPGMSSANMHSGMGSGQGSSVSRPRETMHMIRPGLAQDSQRQMLVPDLQMQVSPRNSQGISPFGGLSSPFPNQTASPPVSSYPLHHQQSHPISPQQPQVLSPHHPHFQGPGNHASNPQQQAYAIRMAKERQQHRYLQQQSQQQLQQPQFAASSLLTSHVQSQSQLPLSSPVQNSSQVQPQTGSPAVSISSLTSASSMNSSMPQHQQKHQSSTQGVVRHAQSSGSGLTNQSGKQRQRQQQQQFPQANRQHPQQRQQPQVQQPAKVVKGVGRGNMMMHQNMPVDPSLVNGVTTNPVNPCLEKGEATAHLMQSQGVYTSSALNAVQPTRQYVSSQSSNQSLPQQKIYSGPTASSTKPIHQMNAHSDSSSQGHVPAVASGLSAAHQSVPSLAMSGSNHQQAPTQQKLVNQSQSALQRVVQPNRQINSDPTNKPQVRDSDTDQHPTSSSSEMDTVTAVPQGTNNATNVAQVGQGLGQRPSANLTSIRHDVSAQWQQPPSQLQQPNSPVPHPQQNQQPLPPVHSQQQAQLLQAGNGNLYSRPGDHRLE
ncbi:chromatin modification-related protein EAF1 B-like isoform X1 [Sesamum indicum]|uniref:Chromatin modification-related protein EAF1 B-like isoform X1 n=1 Tax=Sesamum indicum TaxID=4182 RepID=A0A6I9TSQ4_SESIN|nr:chromatin modification-related protein EAF1 B-like isoform X1 [Sesamum indicum]XP_011089676.1 chromatin modification-related protein EAF1 B-like isoform X1 [Sesamum indicum]XP_011089679.1 chromatin modification-related protein EAF1 B-like isoform X1 [Sesamum indicum]XP_020552650.1 chromatin modification-related protein EAF1 B-like isoform X1 [Sesamum indicum]XP_020552651.1 chromatin modification-related protein EAF1 B-like isoform X1 [Sesamum indicum]